MDRPKEFYSSDALSHFVNTLAIELKESLNGSRKTNPEVTLHIPIQKVTFQSFCDNLMQKPQVDSNTGHLRLCTFPGDADCLLGSGWWYRILNASGDTSLIVGETFQFWLFERSCLNEYSVELIPCLRFRGFNFVCRFVRKSASRKDMLEVLGQQ